MRAPFHLSSFVLNRARLRRILSVLSLLLLDGVAVSIAALPKPALPFAGHTFQIDSPSVPAWLLALTVTLALAGVCGVYRRRRQRRSLVRLAIWALSVLAVLVGAALALDRSSILLTVGLCWLAGLVVALGFRLLYDAAIAGTVGTDEDAERILVVGERDGARRFMAALNDHEGQRLHRLVAVVEPDRLEHLESLIVREGPQAIMLLDRTCRGADLETLLDISRRRGIRLQVPGERLGEAAVCRLPGVSGPVFAARPSALRRRRYLIKRGLDVVVALALLILFSPFFLIIAILAKLGSPGPVFYVSWRMGVCERPFPCYKFRTMCADADVRQEELEDRNEANGCLFKLTDDPRVTPVGRFLRRTSLDELPQLINVVCGQMSLVGPRPLPLRDVALMADRDKLRHVVLPGMTGLWQVSGRSRLDAGDMMRLDHEYIQAWSLRADLRILARTVGAVASRRGAF